jgi:hypothetical protein
MSPRYLVEHSRSDVLKHSLLMEPLDILVMSSAYDQSRYCRSQDQNGLTVYFKEILGCQLNSRQAAILNLAKSCSSLRNAGMVMTSESPERARTGERTGIV